MARPSRACKQPDRYKPESWAASKSKSEPYSGPTTRSRARALPPPEDRPDTTTKSRSELDETVSSKSESCTSRKPRRRKFAKSAPQKPDINKHDVKLDTRPIEPAARTSNSKVASKSLVSAPQELSESRPGLPFAAQAQIQLVLQEGLYPIKKQHKLENSRARNPTYLFRASSPKSGSGIEIIDDKKSVKLVPQAFLEGSTGHKNIYEIPEMVEMVTGHLSGEVISSEFSSWAGSFSVAMYFLKWHTKHPKARISIIDTRRFPDTAIYHVNEFSKAGFRVGQYVHEYLVHGIVNGGVGSGYASVLWSDLEKNGMGGVMPHPSLFTWQLMRDLQPSETAIEPLKTEEIEAVIRVALTWGSDFVVPVTAALLSYKHRNWQRPDSELAKREVEAIAEVLRQGGKASVEDYSQVDAVMKDIVYTHYYVDIKQQITLLRLLSEYTHGHKARVRAKTAKKKVAKAKSLVGRTGIEKNKAAVSKKRKR